MNYLDCFVLGIKGFLIVLGFAMSAFVAIGILALVASLCGLGKHKNDI